LLSKSELEKHMKSSTLYNIHEPYKSYYLSTDPYLSVYEEPSALPSTENTTQELPSSREFLHLPKLPMYDILVQWLPAWAYGALIGLGALIGIALAIVFFGFALHFIIVHPSLFLT
jgi:hypothetical protein